MIQRLLDLDWLAERFDRVLAGLFVSGFTLYIASAFVGQGADLIVGDAAEHFEYVRALMAEGHLPASVIRFPFGVALIGSIGYVPAYLLGAIVVGGSPAWQTGWALPLQVAYAIPLVAFSWVALRTNVSTLLWLGWPARVVKPAVLFWLLTTNLAWYIFKEPAMTEAPTYAALSLYYWTILRAFYPRSTIEADAPQAPPSWLKSAALAGLWLGIAGIVRQQNILHALSLPLLLWFAPGGPGASRRLRILAVAGLVAGAIFLLSWLVWYAGTGTLVGFSYAEGHFNWTNPKPWLVLFVPGYHGLFVFHPAFLLAALGLWPFLRMHRRLRAAWVVGILTQAYLVSTWYWLSFGASVGHRGFFPVFPLLLAGFAACAAEMDRRGWSRAWVAAMYVLLAGNVAVMLLVALRVLDPTGGGLPPNRGF